MSSHEQRIQELNARIEDIDQQVAALADERKSASLPAAAGSKDALKQVARCDDAVDQLLKERRTVVAASEQVEGLIAAAQAAAEQANQLERERAAGEAAAALVVLHEEIDVALIHLREMFDRSL
jgi:hypothetical protein